MVLVDPAEAFRGVVVLMAPHMDDCVLACGGSIARMPLKECIHVVYATDGRRSPEPVVLWRDPVWPDLGVVRMAEARQAMAALGIPERNVHFLGLPDGCLRNNRLALDRSLAQIMNRIRPDHVWAPFRYDRHPDHLALNGAVIAVWREVASRAQLFEYFVYHKWRLLPGGDVRRYIRPDLLYEVDIGAVSLQKRAALDCFKSQTTRFYPWQARPNLTPQLLDDASREAEMFLRYDPALPGPAVFARAVPWIRIVHRLEPFLKKRKDRAMAWWRRGVGRG